MKIIPIILSGGSGSRLWPLSRQAYPKQLLNLLGSHTLLQTTVLRANALSHTSEPLLICNNDHRFLVAEQILQLGIKPLEIILEPIKRNTAPAVAIAALRCMAEDSESIMLVLPADHLIENLEELQKAVDRGTMAATEDYLVTFGVKPVRPETGYGYIKKGEALFDGSFRVARFVEKPDLSTAKEYLSSGEYLWNSGMFLFRPDAFLEELQKYEPDMYKACEAAFNRSSKDLDFLRIAEEHFKRSPSTSIDYAIMERTNKAVVVNLDCDWNDIGSWSSLWNISEKDQHGNVVKGDVVLEEVSNSLIMADRRLVSALGVNDMVIVETSDAVLIADKQRSQEIKKIVKHLKKQGREEFLFHSKVYRPWGSYEGLVIGDRFQVKLIIVKPGAKLSVQMHHHRAEHWIIVKGTARVQRGEETLLLTENQSTFIPLGTVHSLENPGKIPLELIEVQSGAYLGEDDIVRFEDVYGRI